MKNKTFVTTLATLSLALAFAPCVLAAEKKMEVSTSDVTFAKKAATGGMMEVALGKLAAEKGTKAEVKEFGQTMVADHGQAGEKLKTIATEKHITLPEKLGPSHQEMVDKMAKLEGAAFDQEYVTNMVADHEKDLVEFKMEAGHSKDAELKAFAAEKSIMVQMHLDKIKMIKASMK